MSVALVTGTSTGIGLAVAVTLARAGHKVYATMRNPAKGESEIKAIAESEKLPITVVTLDVNSDQSVAELFSKLEPLDVLVNNAGIAPMAAVEETSLSEFRETMETNFFGALRCIKAVLPGMRERRSGCIINITSVVGQVANPGQGAYCSSKWALEALSESLAGEVKAFGIRVALVEPGVIATPIFGKMGERNGSPYPYKRRLDAYFRSYVNQRPVSPYVVGEVVRGIVGSDSWQFRYPAGPDAAAFMQRRAQISDEDWIAGGAASDEEYAARVERSLGIKLEW